MNHIVSTMAHIFSYLMFHSKWIKWADDPIDKFEAETMSQVAAGGILLMMTLFFGTLITKHVFFGALPDSKGTSFGALRERHRNMNTSKYKIFHRKAACLRPAITAMADLNGIRFHRRGKCHIVPRALRMGAKYEFTNSSGQNLLLMLQQTSEFRVSRSCS